MKNKIIYSTLFLLVFFLVTFGIIYLNESYQNIFKLDFTEVQSIEEDLKFDPSDPGGSFENLKEYFDTKLRQEILDSIQATKRVRVDTVYQEILKDEMLVDSIATLNSELRQLQNELASVETTLEEKDLQEDALSEDWAKKTAKLIESMNPKNAAKVIQKYSDNEARELIYRMKKNKAAAILSQLNPEFVNRITKSQI